MDLTTAFNRAVDVVQSLPKTTGSIQSSYEEKLAMYSLFKQATAGNVVGVRPSIFDMLKRSKWDAWKDKENMSPEDAMRGYVRCLLQVLRKYKDRKEARELIREFEGTDQSRGQDDLGLQGWAGDSYETFAPSSSSIAPDSDSSPSSSPPVNLLSLPLPPAHPSAPSSLYLPPPDPSLPPPDIPPSMLPRPMTRPPSIASSSRRDAYYPTPRPGSVTGSASNYRPGGGSAAAGRAGSSYAQGGMLGRTMTPTSQPLPRYATPSAFPGPAPTQAISTIYPSAPSSTVHAPVPHSHAHSLQPLTQRRSLTPPTDSSSEIHETLERIQRSLNLIFERLLLLENPALPSPSPPSSSPASFLSPLLSFISPFAPLPSGAGRWRIAFSAVKRALFDLGLLAFLISVGVAIMANKRGARKGSVRAFWLGVLRIARGRAGSGERDVVRAAS